MVSVVNIRRFAQVFCLTLACLSFGGAIASTASADICDDLIRASRSTEASIRAVERRYGHGSLESLAEMRVELQRGFTANQNIVRTSPPGSLASRNAASWLRAYPNRFQTVDTRWRELYSRLESLLETRERIHDRVIRARCGDRRPPEDDPPDPPGCFPFNSDVQPANDVRDQPANDVDPTTRGRARQLLQDLLAQSPSDVPVFARVLADGRVVDYVTGVQVVNPAYRDVPVSVDFHPGSPFAAGQAVWVSFYSTQVGGASLSLASFASSTGQPLVYTPNDSPVVTEVPSVWEVFPNGLVVIPSVPAGAGAGVRAVQPLGEYMLRAPGGVRAVFERLQQLLEGFRAIPSPTSDRRQPGRSRGCHAVFVLGKTKVVGKSCSRNAPYGRWEWKAFSETTEAGGGISAKWSESYSRSEGFKPLSGVRVFVHQNTDEEVAGWSPEKLGDYRLALPVLAGKYARAFKNWNAQLATGGRHAGKIVHQVSNRWGGGEAKQIRSVPQAGCDIAPLEGYKERNIPQ